MSLSTLRPERHRGHVGHPSLTKIRFRPASSLSFDARGLANVPMQIGNAGTVNEALTAMLARLRYVPPMEARDFLRDYSDTRFGRLVLYLLAYSNNALDWDQTGLRIGFDSQDLVAGFEPQYHHIFPRKFLDATVSPAGVEALANIAVIGPSINIRISAQNPMNYVSKYKISDHKLKQQHIFDLTSTTIEQFPNWVQERAGTLVSATNKFFEGLRG